MSKFETHILKWKFKKIAIAYLIVALIALIGCVATVGTVFKDRIAFAIQYSRVSEAVEKSNHDLQSKIDKLASSSDIVDILILDSNNNVTYSAKDSALASGQFTLTKAGEDKDYLVTSSNSDVVFKFVKGDDFMLDSVFNHDFGDIRNEYNDESFYENDFSNKTVYMLSYLGNRDSSSKVYIISSPTSVSGGTMTLKIVATIAILFFMIYWVLLALWAYQNASKSKLHPLHWGIIVLMTNIAGVIVYLLYKYGNATCSACGASQNKSHLYCTLCGTRIGETCENCGGILSKKDIFCSHCGEKIR